METIKSVLVHLFVGIILTHFSTIIYGMVGSVVLGGGFDNLTAIGLAS